MPLEVVVVVAVVIGTVGLVKEEKLENMLLDVVVVVVVVLVTAGLPKNEDNAAPAFAVAEDEAVVVVGALGLLTLLSSLLPRLLPMLVILLRVERVALAALEVFREKDEAKLVVEVVVWVVVEVTAPY